MHAYSRTEVEDAFEEARKAVSKPLHEMSKAYHNGAHHGMGDEPLGHFAHHGAEGSHVMGGHAKGGESLPMWLRTTTP